MRKTILFLSFILAASIGFTHAQDIFKKHGLKKKPLTFCDGQYNEFFNNPEVVQIGTVMVNTRTNKVVKLLDENTPKTTYKAEFSSMCIDPHAEKYYSVSPYAYCKGNPVNMIDPDGRDATIIIKDGKVIVQANIILYSKNGKVDSKIVNKFQNQIVSAWSKDKNGNARTYTKDGKTYQVSFDVKVTAGSSNLANEDNRNYNGKNNYIQVVNGNDNTVRSKVEGTNSGVWASETKEAYHEFGHLLGLQDRYTDTENGSKPNSGYEGNVMGSYGGQVEQKNINAFLYNPVNSLIQSNNVLDNAIKNKILIPYFPTPEYIINSDNKEGE